MGKQFHQEVRWQSVVVETRVHRPIPHSKGHNWQVQSIFDFELFVKKITKRVNSSPKFIIKKVTNNDWKGKWTKKLELGWRKII